MTTARRRGFTIIEALTALFLVSVTSVVIVGIPRGCTGTKLKGYKTQAISDLLSLRTAQEKLFAQTGRYGTLAEIDALFESTSGVSAPRIVVQGGQWSASVTHSRLPGLVCAIGVGASNPLGLVAGEGEPFCR